VRHSKYDDNINFKHERSILREIKDKLKVCQNGSHLRGIGLKAWLSVKI